VTPFPHGDGAAVRPSVGLDHDTAAVAARFADHDSRAADAYVDVGPARAGSDRPWQFRRAAARPSARQPPSRLQAVWFSLSFLSGVQQPPQRRIDKSFRTRAAEPLRDIDLILLRPMF
jgi:hypothetical protein